MTTEVSHDVQPSNNTFGGGFEADNGALDSILSNTGIRKQLGSQNAHSMKRMSQYYADTSSSSAHIHKKGVQNATKAIQELHLKRQSMYTRSSPTDDSSAQILSSAAAGAMTTTNAAATSTWDQRRVKPSSSGVVMRTDATIRRHTLAPNAGARDFRDGRSGRVCTETNAENTDDFLADSTALDDILLQEKIEVADKSKRASIHFGAMRVLNKNKQQKKYQTVQSDVTECDSAPFTPSGNRNHLHRNVNQTTTPRRYTLSHNRNLDSYTTSFDAAPSTPSQRPHRTLPVPQSAHRTTVGMLHVNSNANANITRTAPRPTHPATAAERGVLMQTPRAQHMRRPPATVGGAVGSRRFCAPGEDDAVVVPTMGILYDGAHVDNAEQQLSVEEEQTKQALLEIRQMELELEQELARELAFEASQGRDGMPVATNDDHVSVAHGAWNEAPPAKTVQPTSQTLVTEGNPAALNLAPPVECNDEMSAELINIGVFGANRTGRRVIANPLLTTMQEPQSYQFVSIATTSPPVISPPRKAPPSIKLTASSAFRPSRRLSLV